MDNSANDVDFAKGALSRVSTIAGNFAARNGSCLAGGLAAELFIAHRALVIADAGQLPQLQRRLPKLMKDLERVCAWPCGVDSRCSILHSIVSNEWSWMTQGAEKRVEKGISAFVNGPYWVVDQYLKKLSQFSKCASKEQLSNDDKAGTATPNAEEYPEHVNMALYSALKEHSSCTCSGYWPEAAEKSHHGRLRLRGDIIQENGRVAFDILFSASPNSCDYWQDLQLTVPTSNHRRWIRHADDVTAGTPSPQRSEQQRIVLPGLFCEIVGAKLESRICCHVQDSKLYHLHHGSPIIQHANPGPSKSLQEILRTHRLSPRMKLVLAYIVTRSFWQYYDSPWMHTKWSSDTIHFLPEPRAEDGRIDTIKQTALFAYKPYFVIKFSDDSDGFMEYCDAHSIIYPYPRVLSLCIILLEISRGQGLSVEETGHIGADLNKKWTLAEQLVKQRKSYGVFDYPRYHKVVASLLNRQLFDDCAISENSTEHVNVAMRKAAIYEVAVAPLEKLLKTLEFADDMYELDPMDENPISDVSTPQTTQGIHVDKSASAQGLDDLMSRHQRDFTSNTLGSHNIISLGDIYYHSPGRQ